MAKKKNEESVKEVWDKLSEEEKEKISKELEEAASKVDQSYSLDEMVKALDKALDGFSDRMDQLCKEFADIFCGEEQEEEKMKPTSKQVINGCNFVEIRQEPVCESTTLIFKNNDDTFEIEVNGYEAHEFFRRLIFNDSNCSGVRKKNQELADEIIALRRAKDKEILGLREDKEYAEKLNKELIDRWQERYGNILEENKLLKTENQHLREDIMRAKNDLHNIKKAKFVRENSVFGLDPSIPAIRIVKENENLKEEVKRLREKYETEGKPLTTRTDILRTAEKCVCGKREQDYGTPESNFQLIADLWNGYLGFTDPGDEVKPTDVAMMMALMKIARIRNGGGTGDSFVDLAGYAACGGEINARRKQTEKPVSKGE